MTIGHVYKSLSLGGMQRGAGSIVRVHHDMGHRVVVFTRDAADGNEYDIDVPFERVVLGGGSYMRPSDDVRTTNLREGLARYRCDLVIHHEYYARSLVDDLRVLEEAGVPTLVQWHSCFSALHMSPWWKGHVCSQLNAVKDHSRGVLALSRVDQTFFELIGIPSVHVPYSDRDLFDSVPAHGKGRGREILWSARFSRGKNPLQAVNVFERVLARNCDAHMTMLGDGPLKKDVEDYLSARPAVAARISLPGFVTDVTPYLRTADVALMTTAFEGFCHAILEAKMAAVPVVGYEMDYLDTAQPGTGYVAVAQNDVEACAERVCDLLDNGSERARLGALARRDFERFAALDQRELYRRAFSLAFDGAGSDVLCVTNLELSGQVLSVLLKHVDVMNGVRQSRPVGPRRGLFRLLARWLHRLPIRQEVNAQ